MKRFSILCCLVLLLNVLCPMVHVHAETVATPTDLCEHDWTFVVDGADGHHKECKLCGLTEKLVGHYTSCTSSTPDVCEACGYQGEDVYLEHNYGCWPDGDDCVFGCLDCKTEYSHIEHVVSCTEPNRCKYCGAVGDWKKVNHIWNTDGENYAVSEGAEGHHYVCQGCDAISATYKHGTTCDDPTHCLECGYEGTIESVLHSWGECVSFGEEGHGYICNVCGEKVVHEHSARCDDPTHCTSCDYEGVIGEDCISHVSDFVYTSDGAEGHHYGCPTCGYVSSSDSHQVYCDDPTHCVDCGAEVQIDENDLWHDLKYVCNNAVEHHLECMKCGYMCWFNPHAANCTNPNLCVSCGYEGPCSNIYHNDQLISTDDAGNLFECSDCGQTSIVPHYAYCDDPTHCCYFFCDYEGNIDNISHHWDEYVVFGEDGHGYVCSACGEKMVYEHRASCDDPTHCMNCDYEGKIEIVQHEYHNYASNGADGHTKTCTVCGETVTESHSAYCTDLTHCMYCGYEGAIETVRHYWDEDELVSFGEEGHGHVCDRCGKKEVSEHQASCTDPTHCADCGYKGTIETISHTSDFTFISDGAEGHHYGCKDCGYISSSGSHYARCNDPTHCTACGYEGEIDQEDLYHSWTLVVSDGTSGHHTECVNCGCFGWSDTHCADCTDPTHCLDCGYEGTCSYLYHDDELISTDDAGHHFTCLDCGRTYTEPHYAHCDNANHCLFCDYEGDIEEIHHYWDEDELVSFGEEGHGHVCEKCGKKEISEHQASCTDPTHCADCGYEGEIDESFLMHDWEYVSDGAATHHQECTKCGYIYSSERHAAYCANPNLCIICGYEGPCGSLYHNYRWISNDDAGHHYQCLDCGAAKTVSHYAFCDDANHCFLCDYEGDIEDIYHYWFEYVSFGEEGCGYVCEKCGEKVVYEHHASCDAPTHCVECGYEGAIENLDHDTVCVSDGENGHIWTCQNCDYTRADKHYAICGNDITICHVCGYKGENIVVHHNRYGDYEGYDADQHWYTCATCKELIKENHSWDDPVIANGKKTYTCSCGKTKVELLHSHTWGDPVTVEPTCTEEGTATYTCTCGKTKVEIIEALGHTLGACVPTGSGAHAQTCTECGNTITTRCTLIETKLGNLDASACIYCGYITWKLDDAASGKQESKAVENAAFQLVDETGAAVESNNLSLVVYESKPEATIVLDSGVNAIVKKALTITVLEDSTPVKLANTVKLSIPMEDDLTGLKLLVVDENGELVEIEYEVIDGVMVFETNILGIFMLVQEI